MIFRFEVTSQMGSEFSRDFGIAPHGVTQQAINGYALLATVGTQMQQNLLSCDQTGSFYKRSSCRHDSRITCQI